MANSTYVAPGVFLVSVNTPNLTPGGITGRVAIILGTAPKGPVQSSNIYITSGDAFRDFGSPSASSPNYSIPLAIQSFFSQAGQGFGLAPGLIIRRVGTTQATGTIAGISGSVTIQAANQYGGSGGNALSVQVGASVYVASQSAYLIPFSVYNGSTGPNSYQNLSAYEPSMTGTNAMFRVYSAILQSPSIVTATAYTNGVFPTAGTYTLSGGSDGLGALVQQSDIDACQSNTVSAGYFMQVLQGDLGSAQMVLTHAELMSSQYNTPRVGVAGPALGTALGDSVTAGTIIYNANNLVTQDGRFIYIGHDGVVVINPSTNTQGNIDGIYLATMAMGAASSLPPQMPLTYKNLFSIQGPATTLTQSQLQSLGLAGCVVVVQPNQGGWIVRDDLTTTPNTSPFAYLVNRSSLDAFIVRLISYTQAHLIGQPVTNTFAQKVVTGYQAVGAQAVNDGIIQAMGTVSPTQSLTDPTTWTVVVNVTQSGEVRVVNLQIATSLA